MAEATKVINSHFGVDKPWREIDHPGGVYFSLLVPRDPNSDTEQREGRLRWTMYQVTSGPTRGRGQVIHHVSVNWVGNAKWTGALQAVGLDPSGVKATDSKPMPGTKKATILNGVKGLPTGTTVTVFEIVTPSKETIFNLSLRVDISNPG